VSNHSKKNGATKPAEQPMRLGPNRPRLEGDELFTWATLHAESRHLHEKINGSGIVFLMKRNLWPDNYIIDEQGFIWTKAAWQAAQQGLEEPPAQVWKEPERGTPEPLTAEAPRPDSGS
jgi:hypothetical protein